MSFASFVSDFQTNAAGYLTTLTSFTNGPEIDTGSIAGSDHNGSTDLNAEDIFDNSTATLGQITLNFNVESPDVSSISSSVNLQIGANTGQSLTTELKDMRAFL
ncbi:hypothetical protein [Metabacillus fastidiosus]|uniref:hypothetical protein n=1 Tax=Metabacillus fastidiosus TaxID=1458 RepID=UPI002DB8665B|nr:hypothetical protein [Metabacillus fastidiosus]MEC2077891.1 hypothetical protein [Metabacillus fastidiosus]